jgi:conjugative transfer signal peptidase TraF
VVAALASVGTARPVVLINTTPSEPEGLYVATAARPEPGRLIAFRAPQAAFPYADTRLSYLRRVPMLKSVAAIPGDDVCSLGGRLRVNGRDQARIAERDARGVALPHWRGCRRLTPGEVFVLSTHAPNSFDSRYFGPVPMNAVIGVYRPFLTTAVRL